VGDVGWVIRELHADDTRHSVTVASSEDYLERSEPGQYRNPTAKDHARIAYGVEEYWY
jgi:hypothetical protein